MVLTLLCCHFFCKFCEIMQVVYLAQLWTRSSSSGCRSEQAPQYPSTRPPLAASCNPSASSTRTTTTTWQSSHWTPPSTVSHGNQYPWQPGRRRRSWRKGMIRFSARMRGRTGVKRSRSGGTAGHRLSRIQIELIKFR